MSENTTPAAPPSDNTAPAQAQPKGRRRAWLIGLGLTLPLLAIGGISWLLDKPQLPRELGEHSQLALDLTRPDALIESASLSRLPADLLTVPLLRDTLTEDFVFYYENHADRLGLAGSLRRIVFEHELTLKDSLIDELLDQPADVALWRGADGKLKHVLLLIKRGGLARVLEPLARVAANDSQLRQVGNLRVDGDEVALYRLRYNAERALLFASYGDKLLVLSSPGMLLEGDYNGAPQGQAATEAVEALLDGDNRLAERFGLGKRGQLKQRISLSSEALALGYQRFIPAFAGLRFELNQQGWQSYLALNEVAAPTALDYTPIWQAMPIGASACVALPTEPALAQRLLEKVGASAEVAKTLSELLGRTAGLCWYADSRLHAPLLVGQLQGSVDGATDNAIGALFGSLIGAQEANVAGGRFPVETRTQGELRTWQRVSSSHFGQYPASQAQHPETLAARAFFRISLARKGSTVLFSLDDRLVDKAIATLDKRFPPLADVLPQDALVVAYLAPQTLATLFEQETLDSLPADMEPVFRNAAQTLLLPKLRALAEHRQYALSLPAGSQPDDPWQWLPLTWQAL